MEQKKNEDIEELLKKNASLEENMKQMRQKQEARAEKSQVSQVGIIAPKYRHLFSQVCCMLLAEHVIGPPDLLAESTL